MARKKETDVAENENPDINAVETDASADDVTENAVAATASADAVTGNCAGEIVENNGAESDEGREQASTDAAKDAQTKNEGAQGETLESISFLSSKHRLPGWQTAAILRMMGWEDDIMVSDEDFRAAVSKLQSRRIGGGRI